MTPVLVDTDILINFLRGRDAAKNFLLSKIEDGPILCSVITVAEIFAGMRPQEEARTKALLDSLELVDGFPPCCRKGRKIQKPYHESDLVSGRLPDCRNCIYSPGGPGNRKHQALPHGRYPEIAVTGDPSPLPGGQVLEQPARRQADAGRAGPDIELLVVAVDEEDRLFRPFTLDHYHHPSRRR